MSCEITMRTMESIQSKFGRTTSPADVAIACHEAGHAVTALALGVPVDLVTIEPNERFTGRCAYTLQEPSTAATREAKDAYAWAYLRITLGGSVAPERMLDGGIRRYEPRSRSDDESVDAALGLLAASRPDRDRSDLLYEARSSVKAILKKHWTELDEVACALLMHRTVSGMKLMRWLCPSAASYVAAPQAAPATARALSGPELATKLEAMVKALGAAEVTRLLQASGLDTTRWLPASARHGRRRSYDTMDGSPSWRAA